MKWGRGEGGVLFFSLGLECVCLLGRKSRRCGMGKKRDSLDEERSEVKMLDGFETLL
jgi:hypothetical protein